MIKVRLKESTVFSLRQDNGDTNKHIEEDAIVYAKYYMW